MKKILVILLSLYSITAFGQNDAQNEYLKQYKEEYEKLLEEFCFKKKKDGSLKRKKDQSKKPVKKTKFTTNDAFEHFFKPFLSNVLVSSNDLVENTTAASLVNDQDKGTLNINYTYISNSVHVWNGGVFAKSKDGIFGIYSTDSWNSDIGFNFGYSYVFEKRAFYDNKKCGELKKKKIEHMHTVLKEYRTLAKSYIEIKNERDKIFEILQDYETTFNSSQKPYSSFDEIKIKKEELRKLDSLIDYYKAVYPEVTGDERIEKIKSNINKAFTHVDTTYGNYNGFLAGWVSLNALISNNTIKASTDGLSDAAKAAYNAKSLGNYILSAAVNGALDIKSLTLFAKLSFGLSLSNYLNHPSLIATPELKYDSTQNIFELYNDAGVKLGTTDQLKTDIISFNTELYIVYFPKLSKLNKNIGLAVRSNILEPIKGTNVVYPSVFTLTAGPVFRVVAKDGYSKGTVGVEMGAINAKYGSRVLKEHFGAQLNIGLPFNTFSKK